MSMNQKEVLGRRSRQEQELEIRISLHLLVHNLKLTMTDFLLSAPESLAVSYTPSFHSEDKHVCRPRFTLSWLIEAYFKLEAQTVSKYTERPEWTDESSAVQIARAINIPGQWLESDLLNHVLDQSSCSCVVSSYENRVLIRLQ
jgi:hypothetical protein